MGLLVGAAGEGRGAPWRVGGGAVRTTEVVEIPACRQFPACRQAHPCGSSLPCSWTAATFNSALDQGVTCSQRHWRVLFPAGALAGNPFLVDRQFIARELGFVGGVCPNSMDAVGAALCTAARVCVLACVRGGLLWE